MKKLLIVVGLAALLAGCASNDNGMGGTGDESMKTDSINNTSGQFHSNASNGTGTATATNSGTEGGSP
ncbi:MAG TPA: hypothetical protein VHC44_18165 [Verrucomicrobiae bacterium]|nr:hypothetical protein [Verrucomicrobiae bacterium]